MEKPMSSAPTAITDTLNAILGIDETSPIYALRNQKPTLVTELQDYYDSIFQPTEDSAAALSLADRLLVAVRVASHTNSTAVADWYAGLASDQDVAADQIARARDVSLPFPETSSLAAAIHHADLLTLRPADARQSDLQALKDAGFTPAGIVSLSQTIAFVSYQLRLIAGLRAIGGLS
jgi:CMD domain protein